jgi:nitric oxide reductase NorD protein
MRSRSRSLLGRPDPAVTVNGSDTSARGIGEQFTLLASAIAGRSVSVEFRDVPATYTDGSILYLSASDHASSLVAVMVQSSLIAAGSLDTQVLTRLIGRPSQARRYVTLEAARAHAQLGVAQPRRLRSVLRDHWDGEIPLTVYDSLRRATSGEDIPLAPFEFGTVRPSAVLRTRIGATGAALSGRRAAKRREVNPSDEDESDDDDGGDVSGLLKALSLPFSNPLMAAILGLAVKASPKRGGADGGAEVDGAVIRSVRQPSEYARLVQSAPLASATQAVRFERDLLYPEWDSNLFRYRNDWCVVHEWEASAACPQPPRRAVDHRLRRGLVRLGMAHRKHNRQPIGEGLDTSALVDFAISARLGERSNENVYESRLRTRHDLGVVVLLDASGSTSDQSGSGSVVWDQQRALTESLVSEMEMVGHRAAAMAFRSWGRHRVTLIKIKDFDVRWGAGPSSRLYALDPAGFTRMGAAVRHASHVLATKAGTGRRLLVVVSDGFAYDQDGYADRYAESDTRRALDEAAAQGVACVCISVGASTDASMLDRTWGNSTHVNLHEAEHAERLVLPALRSALVSAARATN